MEKSAKYNFNLPNSANDETADINDISDNFRIIDKIMNETDQTFKPTSTKAASGKAVNEAISRIQIIDENTEFIFDGGNADQSILVDIVVDDILSENSINAIMNKTVAKKFSGLDGDLSNISNDLSETKSVVNSLKNRAYIAESGYSGGWNYRKISDGMVMLWGTIPETGANMTVKDNGIYQSAKRSIALPFAVANAVCTGQASNGVLLTNVWASTDDSNLNYTIGHIEPRESQDCAVRIFIIGNWK